jgi:hypothetical protein
MMNKELLILIYISRVVTFGGELQLLWQLKKKRENYKKKGKVFLNTLSSLIVQFHLVQNNLLKYCPRPP